MLRFRSPNSHAVPGDVADLLAVGQLIDAAMQPGNFFAAPELRLTWVFARAETIPWEIFRGRLVEPTRLQKTFLSWHVLQDADPVISVKLDVHERRIHVTRGFLAYVWEGYDSGGGVIESRETTKWTRELVGTIALGEFADLESVHDELICLLWQAVVGTSRLPLTSVEAPLPAFSFGHLHYLYEAGAGEQTWASWEDWLVRGFNAPCAWGETVKLVEFVLRRPPAARAARLDELPDNAWKRGLMASLFNDVSLSPHTHFLENALAHFSGLTLLLRKVCRHLTAYDLVTFHHRGANYPDALLLDAALHRYIEEINHWDFALSPEDADGRWLRRPLRQACLLRRHYQAHRVPDAPTSPGENARVMPTSYPRVPEDQLAQCSHRRRALFAEKPLAAMLTPFTISVLAQSVADLGHLDERVEMGLGLFIDRPLGYAKQLGEPDLTPILAYEAYSPSMARRRWRELKKLCTELAIPVDAQELDPLFENGPWPAGLAHAELADCPLPVAALSDVRKVAHDFVVLRTLPRGLKELLALFDWQPLLERFRLHFLATGNVRLCVQTWNETKEPVLALYDEELRRRVELSVDGREGYVSRAGCEWPRAGLRVRAAWEDGGDAGFGALSEPEALAKVCFPSLTLQARK
jgi:hypothetical protein